MARKSKYPNIPAYSEFFNSTLSALIALGGSGSNAEINQKIYELVDISEEMTSVPHADGEDGISEIDYRLAWTRSYLKVYGLIHNSARGIWTLNDISINPDAYNSADIVKKFREERKKGKKVSGDDKSNNDEVRQEEISDDAQEMGHCDELDDFNWKDTLLHTLYQISPAAFERLTQRLLRESGFSKVEVTGKVGDGGIDGKGIVNFHGLLSFHVVFQCKRYKGAVS